VKSNFAKDETKGIFVWFRAGGYKDMSSILADRYIEPSFMSTNAGGGVSCGASANEYSCAKEPK
jgi:hypothetical protein